MKSRTERALVLLMATCLMAGCHATSSWKTYKGELREGNYRIRLPDVIKASGVTNIPTLYVANCGLMWIDMDSLAPGSVAGGVSLNWLEGRTWGGISWSNASRAIRFAISPGDGSPPGSTALDINSDGCDITMWQTNDKIIATFRIWSDGTNAYLWLNDRQPSDQPEFVVKKSSNGVFRLQSVMHGGAEQSSPPVPK